KEFPERSVKEKARYVAEDRLELKVGINEELHEQLKRVQDLICQSSRSKVSIEEALEELARFYLERKDPVKKAERSKTKTLAPDRKAADPSLIGYPTTRRRLSAALKHAVMKRDGGRCTEKGCIVSACANIQRKKMARHPSYPAAQP